MSATVESPMVFLDEGPPDGDHLSKLWSLIADGQESLDATGGWVLKRVNGQADGWTSTAASSTTGRRAGVTT